MKKLLLPVLLSLSSGVFAAELFIAKGVVSGECNDRELLKRAREVATQKAMDHFGSRVRVHRVMNEWNRLLSGSYWNACLEEIAISEISFTEDGGRFDSFKVKATGSHRDNTSIAQDNAVLKATLACGTNVKRLSEWKIGGRYWEVTATATFECQEN